MAQKLTEFNLPISQNVLDIEDKTRSNIFTWRGQFSPQLIESLLFTYCPRNATVLDPFVGSGTVLYEAACFGLQAFGYEVNPAAWILSKIYEFANLESSKRAESLNSVRDELESYFPRQILFDSRLSKEVDLTSFQDNLSNVYSHISSDEKAIIDALVILLDLANNPLTVDRIHHTFASLCQVIDNLPYSDQPITTSLCDARGLPLEENTIDFIVTSPPYINVFNYHQNYRRSAETLGWDLLKIAKSEIGSNRANRANRFFTVIQYCLDIALVLREMHRVCKSNSRLIFVVGYESNVLGVPFYNSEIISNISTRSGAFELIMAQKRTFKNKFGKNIREDLLHLVKRNIAISTSDWNEIARGIAHEILINGLEVVPEGNKHSLIDAIEKVPSLGNSPFLTSQLASSHHTISQLTTSRPAVYDSTKNKKTMPKLPTTHHDKLLACLSNSRLPAADRGRVEEAQKKYQQWIQELESVESGQPDTVERLVEATNRYKRFIELDLIFDSPDNFLYRQKGQLKLDKLNDI